MFARGVELLILVASRCVCVSLLLSPPLVRRVVLLEVFEDGSNIVLFALPVKLQRVASECQGLQEEPVADSQQLLEMPDLVKPEMQDFEVSKRLDSGQGFQFVMAQVQMVDTLEFRGHEVKYLYALVVQMECFVVRVLLVVE